MQQWTPARHIRAIGAWPSLPARSLHSHHSSYHHNNHTRKVHSSTHPRQPKGTQRTNHRTSQSLPLPPFLQPHNHTNKLSSLKLTRRTKSPPPSIYIPSTVRTRTRAENKRHAPFSTAFAENPYAHALATPVREDRFSDARLPNSCLIDLHLADVGGIEDADVDVDVDTESDAGSANGSTSTSSRTKEKEREREISLLPLRLAAELISKKKPAPLLTAAEKSARDAGTIHADSIPGAPSGSASYVLARRAAIDYITAKPKTRVKGKAVGRRTLMTSGSAKLGWRNDMGDFILDALRRVVVKKLNWFFVNKKKPDSPGAVVGMPGGAGRERLDEIDGVMCVLRLRPADVARPAGGGKSPRGLRPRTGDAKQAASLNRELDEMLAEGEQHDTAQAEGSTASPSTDSTSRSPQSPEENSTTGFSTPTPTPLALPNKSQTHRLRTGHWSTSTHDPPFLSSTNIPAPPAAPSHTYFPTLPYRNRRVAAYNLPYLLGEEKTAALLKGTVFAEQELVAVTGNVGTVGCQVWLLKLAAYVGGRKGEGGLV